MARTLARPEPRRRLTWPADSPRVGHAPWRGQRTAAGRTALAPDRRAGAPDLQRQPDRVAAPTGAPGSTRPTSSPTARATGIETIAIHASYLINLAGSAEPFASQSRRGSSHELQRAPAYGASLVNTHIGSHRGVGADAGLRRIVDNVRAVLDAVAAVGAAGARELVGRRRPARLADRGAGADPGRDRRCERRGPARLLPRHRPPVGRRLRHLDRGGRCAGSWTGSRS